MTVPAQELTGGRTQRAGIPPNPFVSLLSVRGLAEEPDDDSKDRAFAPDLNLDQIIAAIAGEREERELITDLLYRQLHDGASIQFRQEVFSDLEDEALFRRVKKSVELLRQVRAHLKQLKEMQSPQQWKGWFLDAVAVYCKAVRSLADELRDGRPTSRGLLAFGTFVAHYTESETFTALAAETDELKKSLGQIRYSVQIRGDRVDVSRYEDEPDYSSVVLGTFERFKQEAVKDYLVPYRSWPGMDHVGAQILTLVARLFGDEFTALDDYCRRHDDFFDSTVRRFEREIQFYLAYMDYITPLRAVGLSFCYPEVGASKEVFATETFDLALARKLASEGGIVVRNDFRLSGPERIFVVSGPNQGGKTTFARTFGQLQHLASVGVPVPGSSARMFLFDRLFTHFAREEDLTKMRGKLEDDLVRIRGALKVATPESVLIMNEIFTSTTLNDARFLGTKVLEKVIQLDLLAVYVTFVDELSLLGESIVSMVSTIVPERPAERTFKVVRGPADGLAYAWAIAEKYDLTYDRLIARVCR